MTRADLLALVQSVAEAAARCVGAKPSQTQRAVHEDGPHWHDVTHGLPMARRVVLAARAGAWRANGEHRGPASPTGDRPEDAATAAAAVLALRERVQRQRDERARLLAADDEALRVIDETARIYDAATVREAAESLGVWGIVARLIVIDSGCDTMVCMVNDPQTAEYVRGLERRIANRGESVSLLAACDAILRRRAEVQP